MLTGSEILQIRENLRERMLTYFEVESYEEKMFLAHFDSFLKLELRAVRSQGREERSVKRIAVASMIIQAHIESNYIGYMYQQFAPIRVSQYPLEYNIPITKIKEGRIYDFDLILGSTDPLKLNLIVVYVTEVTRSRITMIVVVPFIALNERTINSGQFLSFDIYHGNEIYLRKSMKQLLGIPENKPVFIESTVNQYAIESS